MVSGRTRFAPSKAKWTNVTSTAAAPAASTNLKCDPGDTEDSLSDWIQLQGINVLLVFT